mmetsp:Transcript_41436/g.105986  ORF Transcript_41436/g.105986 Transcript_41436/m.105986 type:complete len:229 (+) Transcript_41436:1075-1761(+)
MQGICLPFFPFFDNRRAELLHLVWCHGSPQITGPLGSPVKPALRSFLILLLLLFNRTDVDACQLKCVSYQRLLDVEIQGRVDPEGWGVIALNQPGLQLAVQHDIHSKYFKAGKSVILVAQHRAVVAAEKGLDRNNRFHSNVTDVAPDFVVVVAMAVHPLAESCKTPLTSLIVRFFIRVELEVLVPFVDCVVCEMHVCCCQITSLWSLIFLCAEASKAFIEYVHPQGVA